jgi:hypothetical protein
MITEGFAGSVINAGPESFEGTFRADFPLPPIKEGNVFLTEPGSPDVASDFISIFPHPVATSFLTVIFRSDPFLQGALCEGQVNCHLIEETGKPQDISFVFGLADGSVIVKSDVEVPGPIAGAGLPGLILASGLLGWWRCQRQSA